MSPPSSTPISAQRSISSYFGGTPTATRIPSSARVWQGFSKGTTIQQLFSTWYHDELDYAELLSTSERAKRARYLEASDLVRRMNTFLNRDEVIPPKPRCDGSPTEDILREYTDWNSELRKLSVRVCERVRKHLNDHNMRGSDEVQGVIKRLRIIDKSRQQKKYLINKHTYFYL